MKTCRTRFVSLRAVSSLILSLFAAFHLSAATLTVSPSVISNTYLGNITLNIGALATGETVIVQKWLDLNGNGSIDAGDILLDTFTVADGGAMIISGVTNISAPFDRNPAPGAISTSLNFAPPMTLENISAHQIYQVLSPTANFLPVTATFTVTNATTGQTLSGIVYSNGVTPLPYAIVAALPDNGYAGATVADASGYYSLNLNPGTYSLIAIAPNYYFDQSLAPTVVLTNGVSFTNSLSLTNGTVTIGGNIYDSVSSNGIGAVMLQLQSGNLFALAFTGTNGNYSTAVTPNFWKIKPAKERLARQAFVTAQKGLQVNTSSGSVTNASLALYKGTALFYGRITDNTGAPLPNIRLDCNDGTNNFYNAIGYSDTNGYYGVAGLGGISSDWSCQANSSDNPIFNDYIVNDPTNLNLVAGQVVPQNFTVLPVTAHITGQVHDNLGNPVAGVDMYADAFIGGNSYGSQNVVTDDSGNYTLGVASGAWGVYFSFGGDSGLDTAGDVDYFQPHPVNIPPTNVVLNITVFQNGTPVISQPQRPSASQFQFNINGTVNGSYDVQVTTNLNIGGWIHLFSLTLTNSPFPVTDIHATDNQRFYRILKNQGGT